MALRVLSRQLSRVGTAPSIRSLTTLPNPLSFPLSFPATEKRPAFSIRLMKQEDLKTIDSLEKITYPAYLTEDISFWQRRYELYPHCSIVACMHKDEVLRTMRLTTLPEWASADVENSVVVGCYMCFPLPERMLEEFVDDMTSEESVRLLEEAVREQSKLMFAFEFFVGPKGRGVGRVMMPLVLALSKQLGFSRICGVALNEKVEIWKKNGWTVLRTLKKGYAAPGTTIPSEDVDYFVLYDLR